MEKQPFYLGAAGFSHALANSRYMSVFVYVYITRQTCYTFMYIVWEIFVARSYFVVDCDAILRSYCIILRCDVELNAGGDFASDLISLRDLRHSTGVPQLYKFPAIAEDLLLPPPLDKAIVFIKGRTMDEGSSLFDRMILLQPVTEQGLTFLGLAVSQRRAQPFPRSLLHCFSFPPAGELLLSMVILNP